jgi:ribosomal protein S18 acetylase RimI-like enzyme
VTTRRTREMTTSPTDRNLYDRGIATAIACWGRFARSSEAAAMHRAPGLAAAVFPTGPERGVYNNAVLDRDMDDGMRAAAIDAMEDAYAAAGVGDFAAWVHETETMTIETLERRGYRCAASTRAMGMPLDAFTLEAARLDAREPTWSEYQAFLQLLGVPPGLLADLDVSAFHISLAQEDGQDVSTVLSFDHHGDCGIYNLGTLDRARRRGLGTALTILHLQGAKQRACSTASLQSTPMAEHVYAGVGFRDLGRIFEYRPE